MDSAQTIPIQEAAIWNLLRDVRDPEVPVLSVLDLGIIREVKVQADQVLIRITPTYTGCPAMDMIRMNIRLKLAEHGYKNVAVEQVLSPAWTTDWITEEGKAKLRAYGIAPPVGKSTDHLSLDQRTIPCPRCGSTKTRLISEFGSTACKALYQCQDCLEPFDHFKCH